EAALWGMVFIDMWYCSNFGGRHWAELVSRDPANVRFAIQAAYWVFAVSGADGGPALAAILNRCRCWEVAEQYVLRRPGAALGGRGGGGGGGGRGAPCGAGWGGGPNLPRRPPRPADSLPGPCSSPRPAGPLSLVVISSEESNARSARGSHNRPA